MTENILIINPFGIGDVLFSTPLVSALKRSYAGCYISYICNIRTKDILETNPDVNEIFVFERDEYRALWSKKKPECIKKFFNFWKRIRKKRFDVVFDLSLGREFAFLCWLAGIKERRGFDYRGRGKFLTHKTPFDGFNDKSVAEYYMGLIETKVKSNMVLVPLSEEIEEIDRFLKQSGVKEQDILVGIAPGGGAAFGSKNAHYKRWPWQSFAELTAKISKYGARPILLLGPGEEQLIRDIKDKIGGDLLVSPKTRIREMASLMRKCRVVVCNDGGMLHIAMSQGVPTVSMFGPTDEKVYGPYPPGKNNLVITSDVECRPCYKRFKLPKCDKRVCMEGISVNTVFNALTKEWL